MGNQTVTLGIWRVLAARRKEVVAMTTTKRVIPQTVIVLVRIVVTTEVRRAWKRRRSSCRGNERCVSRSSMKMKMMVSRQRVNPIQPVWRGNYLAVPGDSVEKK